MLSGKRPCPCHSDKRYADCCWPFHSGARDAPTPEALMRSRYAAFALGDGAYLTLTLAKTHPDAQIPKHELIAHLSEVIRKFVGLRILHSAVHGDTGEVLFHAKLYDRGADASFAELSQFVREGAAWRYASGEIGEIDELLRRIRPY